MAPLHWFSFLPSSRVLLHWCSICRNSPTSDCISGMFLIVLSFYRSLLGNSRLILIDFCNALFHLYKKRCQLSECHYWVWQLLQFCLSNVVPVPWAHPSQGFALMPYIIHFHPSWVFKFAFTVLKFIFSVLFSVLWVLLMEEPVLPFQTVFITIIFQNGILLSLYFSLM